MVAGMDDNGNGKVTLAVIGTKLDHLTAIVTEMRAEVKAHGNRLDCDETIMGRYDERLKDVEEKSKSWNVLNSIGAALAFLVAALKGEF